MRVVTLGGLDYLDYPSLNTEPKLFGNSTAADMDFSQEEVDAMYAEIPSTQLTSKQITLARVYFYGGFAMMAGATALVISRMR